MAERVIGGFFFVPRSQDLQDERRLKTYEFLHATFGEYLVARLINKELADIAEEMAFAEARNRPTRPDDSFLYALTRNASACGDCSNGSRNAPIWIGRLFVTSVSVWPIGSAAWMAWTTDPRTDERSRPMSPDEDLAERVRKVIDENRYLTLGTSEPDGRPRLSPVYFTHVGYRDFYWVSSLTARHSANIDARPEIAIVVFDSTAPIGQGRAVYIDAQASLVPDSDLPRRCAEAFARVSPGAKQFQPHELSGDAPLRLYRAEAARHEIHIPGRDPKYGAGIDTRREVAL